jgi:preprotein translocase subunit Sec63
MMHTNGLQRLHLSFCDITAGNTQSRCELIFLSICTPAYGRGICVQAYKKMALRHHPDKVAVEEREEAEAKFKLLGAAHAVLSDPDKRQKYDAGTDPLCFYDCVLIAVPSEKWFSLVPAVLLVGFIAWGCVCAHPAVSV